MFAILLHSTSQLDVSKLKLTTRFLLYYSPELHTLLVDAVMEVWQFQKTYEDREKEYCAVFDDFDQNSSVVGCSSVWATHLSNILQQHSWIGVWFPSHKDCFDYELYSPATLCVTVNKINYEELSADVNVQHAERYSKKLSEECVEVPLKNLFVAREQDIDGVDFEAIANILDQLRIFYHYLVWPWDEDVEFNFVSFLPKLKNRLKLYHDIEDGTFNRMAQKNFLTHVSRGKKIHEQMQMLLSESMEKIDFQEGLKISMDLYNRLKIVQYKLRHFEDMNMRNHVNFLNSEWKDSPGCHLILPKTCNIAGYIDIINRANKLLPNTDCKNTSRSLRETLENHANDDVILISSGVHHLDSERFDWNVTMQGIKPDDEPPTIMDQTSYWYFLRTTGDNVVFRGLNICLRNCKVAIYVSEGVAELDSVILNVERSEKCVALVVEHNASLIANRCRFVDYNLAIVCLPGSAIELTNCVFENIETCVEIMVGAQVCMVDCDLSGCKEGCVKYNDGSYENQCKSLDSLSSLDTVSFRSVKFRDESRAVMFV